MDHLEIVLVTLLIAVTGLGALASRVGIPYPILLVLGGLVLGFVPGIPDVELEPELVLVVFLPPLLYGAAFFTGLRELRADARAITLLSVGLVLATTVTVAFTVHALVTGLPWDACFALGAIVAPTDPVAATEISRRLAERIDAGRLLRPGGQEREIRACAVHASTLLARRLGVDEQTLDHWLWSRGRQPRYKAIARHRCRTVFY